MSSSEAITVSYDDGAQAPVMFDTPDCFIPGTPDGLMVFSVSYQTLNVEFSLSLWDATQLNDYRTTFLTSLDHVEDQNEGMVPTSGASLAFGFLGHVLKSRAPTGILSRLFYAVKTDIMQEKEIHCFLAELSEGATVRKSILRTYVALVTKLSIPLPPAPNALLAAAQSNKGQILLAFGGQSLANANCVEEVAELYLLHQPLLEPLVTSLSHLLHDLACHRDTKAFYLGREIDLMAWLEDRARRPSKSFLATAAVSFPIIGISGLLHYYTLCRLLGKLPGELAQGLEGVTGHSQGLVLAAAVARCHDWESFFIEARWAVELLFWIGYESQMAAPQSFISPTMVNDSIQAGEGAPSHMLLVRGMSKDDLSNVVATGNNYLAERERVYLSLINSSTDHVVGGPPRSLRGLTLRLRELRARDGLDQSRIPYSQRKPVITSLFLPINAPFHTPHLQGVVDRVAARIAQSWPEPAKISSLQIPVLDTETGLDLREAHEPEANVTRLLIQAITIKQVDWPKALQIGVGIKYSHIVTLGIGRFAGMVYQNVDGRGVHVTDGSSLDGASTAMVGSRTDIFKTDSNVRVRAWEEQFRPRLVPSSDNGHYKVETRLSHILKAPPIIVAGMTPTTVPWDFASSVTHAGYHIELAGGGYHSPVAMTTAIERLAGSIPAGRGITCNLIYADPKGIGYQIPLIRQLISNGAPIRGLTIGAGVPSLEVASQYIQTLGIEHISFKPGSIGAIRDVIKIANTHPTFPVILQWTGGRGGGHHSCEDFHQPLLETYSEIRRCSNLYLVVGSGFGDGEGMFPYLTGTWSLPFARPAMPCDGLLLGSRMMVATDAHTSPGVKRLLVEAPGVDDLDWEKSYLGAEAAGGVLTVTSEMGQPIHKIATRGVALWREMDDTIFSLPKPERKAALLKRKDYIIRRLNADFAKPWFGENAEGEVVDLEDMTYSEVLCRLIKLMYVIHQKRWIDPSYRELVGEFAARSLERQGSSTLNLSLLDEPVRLVSELIRDCPDIAEQLLHPEDVLFFVHSCEKRGRKPVNFVVALDDDFEHWFKKDSLWQSEDLDAVPEHDPERVCILQSPVSVRYLTRDDQSSKEILDEIHNELVDLLRGIEEPRITEALTGASLAVPDNLSCGIAVDAMEDYVTFRPVAGHDLPSEEEWIECLRPYTSPAIFALIKEKKLFEAASRRSRSNPFRRILGARHGYSLTLDRSLDKAFLRVDTTNETVFRVTADKSLEKLHLELVHGDSVPTGPATLTLQWEFSKHILQLIDITTNRNSHIQDFYSHLWLGQAGPRPETLTDKFTSNEFKLTEDLHHALCGAVSHALPGIANVAQTRVLPLETAAIAAWEALVSPLLIRDLGGDILRLVHQSIGVKYVSGADPMRVGESITTVSSIRAVTIQPAGKSVKIEARLMRNDCHIATVISEFLIKGKFNDYQNTFSYEEQPVMALQVSSKIDEAVLKDRSWLQLDDPSIPLVGKTLVFQLQTHSQWSSSQRNAPDLKVRGTVENLLWNGTKISVGFVSFDAAASQGNPVLDFLERKGKAIDNILPLKTPGWAAESEVAVLMPSHTQLYAEVSGDCNPIHASPIFAELAELPGPIMHGMYTAAVCRKVVEDLVVPGEPHRLQRFDSSFVGMVMPGDRLVVGIAHTAMKNGRMVLQVTARHEESGEEVLHGEAEIDQPSTAYLFTGQGSQSVGMGMTLYETSPAAKAVYDEVDSYVKDTYGWSVLQVIRENPKELTVHFRGRQGQRILQNYLKMKSEVVTEDGTRLPMPVIPGLSSHSLSHTFADSRGLLQSTLFAQPAIVLVERATFAHMQENGLIQQGAVFAGHSLGEYGALSSMTDFVSITDMLSIIIYRGLTMQLAIPRSVEGHTGYSMVAANPSRVGKHFNDKALRHLVCYIQQESGELLEIVNFNVEGDQYVCAGHVRNIYCLTEVLDAVAARKFNPESVQEFLSSPQPRTTYLGKAVTQTIAHSKSLQLGTELRRGKATIPLVGIDVPFHSSRLKPGIPAWREFLRGRIKAETIRPELLVGKFIPNVVGKPFSLSSSFVKEVAEITHSSALQRLV